MGKSYSSSWKKKKKTIHHPGEKVCRVVEINHHRGEKEENYSSLCRERLFGTCCRVGNVGENVEKLGTNHHPVEKVCKSFEVVEENQSSSCTEKIL